MGAILISFPNPVNQWLESHTKSGFLHINRFFGQSSLKRKEVRKIGWKMTQTPKGCPLELMSWHGIKLRSLDHDHNLKILPQNETTPYNSRKAPKDTNGANSKGTQVPAPTEWLQRFVLKLSVCEVRSFDTTTIDAIRSVPSEVWWLWHIIFLSHSLTGSAAQNSRLRESQQ